MYPEPVCKIKDKWKLSEDLFACSLSQQGCVVYEGGNDIACSRTTQDLLRQKNCEFIPAQCTLTSCFKLLMSFCATIVIRRSIQGLWETTFESKSTPRTSSAQWRPHILAQLSSAQSLHLQYGWTGHGTRTEKAVTHRVEPAFCFEGWEG